MKAGDKVFHLHKPEVMGVVTRRIPGGYYHVQFPSGKEVVPADKLAAWDG